MLTDEQLAAIRVTNERAYELVGNLAAGTERWRMTIPADEQRDSDLILSVALANADKLLAEVERMRPVVERAQEWREQFARPSTHAMPRQRALCDAVDVYESEMEAIAAANQPGGNAPVESAPAIEGSSS